MDFVATRNKWQSASWRITPHKSLRASAPNRGHKRTQIIGTIRARHTDEDNEYTKVRHQDQHQDQGQDQENWIYEHGFLLHKTMLWATQANLFER